MKIPFDKCGLCCHSLANTLKSYNNQKAKILFPSIEKYTHSFMLMSQWNQKISCGQKKNHIAPNMKSHFQTVVQNDCVDFVPISVREKFYDLGEGVH